jgi:cyclic beta-1,2-glucan synthetase
LEIESVMPEPRRFGSPRAAAPHTHLLSNGNYSVMLTAAGSGFSRWRDLSLTRWREDATCDPWGSYFYLRDTQSGQCWSAGFQPVGGKPDSYEAAFFEDRAEITRRDGSIRTCMQIVVADEDDAEVRRISLTNDGPELREIELTSYAEAVLNAPAADSAHPAFSKMFIQTEFDADRGALLATRRPGDPKQAQLWMVHLSVLDAEAIGPLQFETDRARFLGRGRIARNAGAILEGQTLSGTVGTVLDPVLALRRCVRLRPGETVHVDFWTGIAADRAQALRLADKLGNSAAFEQAKTGSSTKVQRQLGDLGISVQDAALFQSMASRLLYADSLQRAVPQQVQNNELGRATLWSHGLSGDLPIVLLEIDALAGLSVVDQLLRARAYWQLKNLQVDLVILNSAASAAEALQTALDAAIKPRSGPGAVLLFASGTLPPGHRDLIHWAARAIFDAGREPLSAQRALSQAAIAERVQTRAPSPAPAPPQRPSSTGSPQRVPPTAALEFFNGLGGFDAAAREYVVVLEEGRWTPTPWINVIANPQFGFLASAESTGSTWSLNAQQNQITPWCNDPVSNLPAEAIYIRDDKSMELWSATALPIRESSRYTVRHGFGYTRSEHRSHGIALDLKQFVPLEDAIKISVFRISNESGEARELCITYYLDWVLGNQNNRAAPYLTTEIEPQTQALLARNPWSVDFQPRVAFMDMAGRQQGYTADRTEFIGRLGSLAEPEALMGQGPLSKRVGAGLDPCGAMQTRIRLGVGETAELVLLLGEESSSAAAVALIERYRSADLDAVLKRVTDFWARTLGVIQVKTPDRSMDIVLNGWLLYQTLSSRIWGRTAFYQSSGAYGFRDQLQDVMALCVSAPAITREHILRAAARQFSEGDVQHWWLPTSGQGIQTRVSDDRIWLAYVVARYLEVTADFAVLEEPVPFLGGGPLKEGSLENFSAPPSGNPAALFEHCVRALDSSLSLGSHGLPLFGTGDWNDGMNRVGVAGRGESVWLGWFLYDTLVRFAPIAESRGAALKAGEWRTHSAALAQALEREAWDGDWYLRGYYDDGSPLGSASADECRIDSIAQSWAVISGAAERSRSIRAMAAVGAQLVDKDAGLVKLFTPPFDRTPHDPGYIKAYPPGLRENGGQYTHAATWSILAFALLGDGDKAGELFSFLNPINHARTAASVQLYKVEPYVICADVYSAPGHLGRGGWTWYTGSAGWMYRVGTEGILGVSLRGRSLRVDPCIPSAWNGFEFTFQFGASQYHITVRNPRGLCRGIGSASLDGRPLEVQPPAGGACEIALIDDGRRHSGEITLG